MFKSWKEVVTAFEGSEEKALGFVNSAFKNREYRKKYNMKRGAIMEMLREDDRYRALEKEAEKKIAAQVKK